MNGMNGWFRNTGRRMMSTAMLMAVVCLAPGIALTAPAAGQCQYEVTAIIDSPPCPFGLHSPVTATGMNNHGAVTGYYIDCLNTDRYGFYWSEKTGLITLPTLDGVIWVLPRGVNDHGVICGSMTMNGVSYLGFTYDINTHPGKYTLLPPTGGGTSSWANAINNNGVVAGARSIGPSGVNPYNAVIWDTNTGEVIDLGVMNGPNSSATDINDGGDAIGWSGNGIGTANNRALLWIGGKGIDLGVLPGMTSSYAKHLNNYQEIVGLSSPPSGTGLHFLWTKGEMNPLFPPEGYDLVGTTDNNDARQITGHIRIAGTSFFDPFLWQHGSFHNLNALIVSAPPNLQINFGSVLSDDGHLLVRAQITGNVVAALLIPVDQPVGDLDFDCAVNVHDVLILLEQWTMKLQSSAGASPSADLNGDGVVNVFDLLILLSNWS